MKNNFRSNYAKYLCGIITEEQFYEGLNDNQSTRTGGLASSPMASSPMARSPMAGSPVSLTDRDPNHLEKLQSRFDSAIRGFQSFLHLHDDELIQISENIVHMEILGSPYGTDAGFHSWFSGKYYNKGFDVFIEDVHSIVSSQGLITPLKGNTEESHYEDLISNLEKLNKDRYKNAIADVNKRHKHINSDSYKDYHKKRAPDPDHEKQRIKYRKIINDIINYRPKS
jgi:hypothetical protein